MHKGLTQKRGTYAVSGLVRAYETILGEQLRLAESEFGWETLEQFHLADEYCKKAETTLSGLLKAIETAIKLFEPDWDRSTVRAKKRHLSPRLVSEHSGLVTSIFHVLRVAESPMTVLHISAEVANNVKIAFKTRDQRERVCKSVNSTLKRYEAKGLVQCHGGKPAKWAIVKEVDEAA
jgi:hypothetical protein